MDKWINNNNIAKVLALCISIILWAMVHLDSATTVPQLNQSMSTRTIDDVVIQVYNFDENKFVLYKLNPDKSTLVVRGNTSQLTSLFSDDSYKVKLDLSNVGPGTHTVPLKWDLPNGVDLVSLNPSSLQVTIEAKETKDFQPTIVTVDEPAAGYQVGTPVITGTSSVKVTLPSSQIGQFAKVQGTVNVKGLNSTLTDKSVKLVAYDSKGQEMQDAAISPPTLSVDVPVTQLFRSVPIELRTTGSLPAGYAFSSVSAGLKQVVVYGPKETLDSLKSYPITVNLDQYVGPGDWTYTTELTPPKGFEKIDPGSVQITVKTTQSDAFEKKTIDDIPIQLNEVGKGLTAQIVTPISGTTSLAVEGDPIVLSKLQAGDITLTAELSSYGEGTFTVPLTPQLPSGVYLVNENSIPSAEVKIANAKDIPTAGQPTSTGNSSPDPSMGVSSTNTLNNSGDLKDDNGSSSPPTDAP